MATLPVILLNGTTADANQVMQDFTEIYTNIDQTNVPSSAKTGTGKFVLDTAPTIASPILTTPIIASFINGTHNHQNSAGGGTLDASVIAAGTLPVARGGTGTTTSTGTGNAVLSTNPTLSGTIGGNLNWSGDQNWGGTTNSFTGTASFFDLATFTEINSNLIPSVDNFFSVGNPGRRWTAIYAINGTIQTSDVRNKKEIQDSNLGLDFLKSLRPVSYHWKEKDNGKHYGLIAQEVLSSLGGQEFAGVQGNEETIYGLNYSELIAPIIKAIQELEKKVNALS